MPKLTYRIIKKGLFESIEKFYLNTVKAIKEVVSLGGPGNLDLENYKIDKPL